MFKHYLISLNKRESITSLREKDKNEFQISAIDDQIKKVKSLERKHKDEIEVLKNKKNQFKKLVMELNELLNADSANAVKLADLKRNIQSQREKLEKNVVQEYMDMDE